MTRAPVKLVPYVIRQGDYLSKLAFTRGFSAPEIWNHPRNADLRKRRGDMDILYPGDILFLPESPPKPFGVSRGNGNDYAASVPTVDVHVILKDAHGPIANESFVVDGFGEPLSGTTNP